MKSRRCCAELYEVLFKYESRYHARMKILFGMALVVTFLWPWSLAAETAHSLTYPRTVNLEGASLTVHHPVLDRWQQGKVEGWVPIEVRLTESSTAGTSSWVGSIRARANAEVDFDQRLVTLSHQEVLDARFEGAPLPDFLASMVRASLGKRPQTILLDELLSMLAEDFVPPQQQTVSYQFRNQPPRVVIVNEPTRLLLIDGQPVQAGISGTELDYLVNTDWQLFYHRPSRQWYVLNGDQWQSQSMLATGGWRSTRDLPPDFSRLSSNGPWAPVMEALPALRDPGPALPFVISLEPTELIQIDGEMRLGGIPGTGGLREVINTESPLFVLQGRWYLLASGRWFSAEELDGDWNYVEQLPEAFSQIPADHARASVLVSVPGTHQARVALIEASLPRENQLMRGAQPGQQVEYAGPPEFVSIEGTALRRAANTPFAVIEHNNFYYLSFEAAWYSSRYPVGPWQVASHLPDELFQIPPSDPLHYVTYLKPVARTQPDDEQQAFSYNAGYLGEYSTSVTVVQGTGWNYSPWIGTRNGYPYWQGYRPPYGGYYPGRYPYGMAYAPAMTRQTVLIESPSRGLRGQSADPSLQDPRLARRGYDYSTPEQAAASRGEADDDWYADPEGKVYRRDEQGWSRHTGDDWSTMDELQRQYGVSSQELEAPRGSQRQAYRQNPKDIERMERYYQRRSTNYNMHANIYVRQ